MQKNDAVSYICTWGMYDPFSVSSMRHCIAISWCVKAIVKKKVDFLDMSQMRDILLNSHCLVHQCVTRLRVIIQIMAITYIYVFLVQLMGVFDVNDVDVGTTYTFASAGVDPQDRAPGG